MRFKSPNSSSYQIFAITGINIISFGIKVGKKARTGLLGFAVERIDPEADERYTMPGFKVFKSIIPRPNQDTHVSTWDHPVQSLAVFYCIACERRTIRRRHNGSDPCGASLLAIH